MNRTGQFSVEPSQHDNATSFYTEGYAKTISKNNEEAKILYDATSKTVMKGSHVPSVTSRSIDINEE